MCDHVKQYCCSEGLSSHLNKLVELDESSLEAIELAEILLESECIVLMVTPLLASSHAMTIPI